MGGERSRSKEGIKRTKRKREGRGGKETPAAKSTVALRRKASGGKTREEWL